MKKIGLIGIGGAGTNTVEHIKDKLEIPMIAVDSISKNAGEISLDMFLRDKKTESGANLADCENEKIDKITDENDIVFITAGLGGNTGSFLAVETAKKAKQKGKMVVALLYKPFSFEGPKRLGNAKDAISKIKDEADFLAIISNDVLLEASQVAMPMTKLFYIADMIVEKAVNKALEIAENTPDDVIRQEIVENLDKELSEYKLVEEIIKGEK